MTEWRQHARALAESLRTTSRWRAAIGSVPRHELIPHYYYVQNDDATWRKVDSSVDAVHSDTTLITALADVPPEDRHRDGLQRGDAGPPVGQ